MSSNPSWPLWTSKVIQSMNHIPMLDILIFQCTFCVTNKPRGNTRCIDSCISCASNMSYQKNVHSWSRNPDLSATNRPWPHTTGMTNDLTTIVVKGLKGKSLLLLCLTKHFLAKIIIMSTLSFLCGQSMSDAPKINASEANSRVPRALSKVPMISMPL